MMPGIFEWCSAEILQLHGLRSMLRVPGGTAKYYHQRDGSGESAGSRCIGFELKKCFVPFRMFMHEASVAVDSQ